MKTYGKHQVPMFDGEEKDEKKVGTEQTEGKGSRLSQQKDEYLEQKSASALIKVGPSDFPIAQRVSSLRSNGVKLKTHPTIALLNGTNNEQNIRKSASTPSLQTKPLQGTEDRLQLRSDFDRTVPNAAQMLLAAREREKQMAMASPRNVGTRLPPLQLSKGPKRIEMEECEKGGDGGQGMIATVATRPLPQLQPLRQCQNAIENSALAQPVPPPPYNATEFVPNSSPITTNISNVPSNQCLGNLQNFPRRRPSSADAIVTNVHKPLPAISAQIGPKRYTMLSRGGYFAKRRANRFLCTTKVKCALVGGFFSVPVLVFALMLLLSSDGFSPHSAEVSSPSSVAASSTAASAPISPVSAPSADVNIVGGAIFQPISMQNASEENKMMKL
ncbi:hypothetical protein niasHT_023893 [Heterodera trifolii]|uniref:Uncharacterized protein n=1 Tax=Heterodera trifolii TaxID=157864 RepID=A0ABD2JCI4_9BILA